MMSHGTCAKLGPWDVGLSEFCMFLALPAMVSLAVCNILTCFSKHSLKIFLTSSLSCQPPPVLQTPIRVRVIFGCKKKTTETQGPCPGLVVSVSALWHISQTQERRHDVSDTWSAAARLTA